MENLKTFIFIGRSGCGKGTQAKLLIEKVESDDPAPTLYYEAGNHFRDFLSGTSYSLDLAKTIADNGGRQPTFLAVRLWSNFLLDKLTGKEHLIIDGTPRALIEAQALDTAMKFYNRQTPTVIYLDIPREESKTRMELRGRSDDRNPGDIDNRLNWFDNDVLPAVEWYKNNSDYKFIQVDGVGTPEEVQERLWADL